MELRRGPAGGSSPRRSPCSASSSSCPSRPRLALSFTDFDIYALGNPDFLRFVGLDNYLRLLALAALLDRAAQHAGTSARSPGPLSVAVSLGAALLLHSRAAAPQGLLPHRLLPAGGHHAGRRRRDLALPLPPPPRAAGSRTRPARHRPDRLARRPALGAAGDHPAGGLEELRIQHGDLPGGTPEHPRVPLRSRAHRRRQRVAPAPTRHPAHAARRHYSSSR